MPAYSSDVLIPRALIPGDTIGLIATGSPVYDPARIDAAVAYFERRGFRTAVGRNARAVDGFLAGSDADRVSDLHEMMSDSNVRAVVCLRGGYGTTRILPLLNFDLFRANPKIIVGFSDVTALQLALWAECRLVTFHGPMGAVDFVGAVDQETEQSFWNTLTGALNGATIQIAEPSPAAIIRSGTSTGRLLGGNLSLIAAMIGTPYLPDFSGSIFVMEDVGEEPYRIDRMLVQVSQSIMLHAVAGVLAGQFSECDPKDSSKPSQSVEAILADFSSRHPLPFLSSCRFGHIPVKLTLPIGILARLDSDSGKLTFCEPAVI
jgi:muramoyltetrapeptide carboxypeptidase